MLENWLSPIELDKIVDFDKLSDYQWGKHIQIYHDTLPDLTTAKVVLIGIDAVGSNQIRRHLYTLSANFGAVNLVDLGNLRRQHPEFLIPLLQELLSSNLVVLLLGHHRVFTYAQYQAYSVLEQLINLVVIDEHIPYTLDKRKQDYDFYYLNRIIDSKKSFLFNLNALAYQSHFVDPKILAHLDALRFEYVRLGKVRRSLEDIEPYVRDADMISFDLAALKHSEAPAHQLSSPNGIFAEEACQLAYYAGMNDKLTSIGFYGYYPDFDERDITAKLTAQMIWYFVEGFCQRTYDLPMHSSKFVRYVVDFKSGDYVLNFWKSKRSDRWWMQVPAVSNQKQERHRLIPCSFNDYQLATRSEIPERLLNALQKF